MSTIVEKIRSEVEKNTAVVQSVITLVTNMAEQIRATQADEVALNTLADDLDKSANDLAAAVAANTPAATV